MEGRNPGKKWSLFEAEDTIKAVFLLAAQSDEPSKLRYTDIITAIAAQGRTINPKMLSKALESLTNKGQITCESSPRDKREKFYSLIPLGLDQTVQIMASVDVARIEAGKGTGAIADLTENWSFYGIPPRMKDRLRPRFRTEARSFRAKIEDILEDEVEEFLAELRRKARLKLGRKRVEEGMIPCEFVLTGPKDLGKLQSLVLYFRTMILEYVPGHRPPVELRGKKKVDLDQALLKKTYNLTEEELDANRRLGEDAMRKTRVMFESLSRKDRARLAERMYALMVLRSSLCAVIHL